MPLYKTIHVNDFTNVLIWKIEEPLPDLMADIHLSENSQNRLNSMKSELHQRGFMSIRHLLKVAGYTDADLQYDEFGKPHLKDGNSISITHSFTFTAIIVSTKDIVGIDIEMQRDKIVKIAHKFTPFEEYKTLANTAAVVRKLTIVWGAKESLYKIYGHRGVSFLHHINVLDFKFDANNTTAQIIFQGNFERFY